MDNRKFEQLIELIINENEEQARALFHDIVVEKSREIYEEIMEEESMSEDMSGGLLDEIEADVNSDEEGMAEDDDEFADIEIDDEEGFGDEDSEEELEDRVVDLEDKLDMLMAEFEELMGHDDDMGDMDDDMGDMDDDMGDEDMMEASDDEEDMMEESLEESVQLTKVSGLYDSKIGGDDGSQTRSPALTKPKVTQTGAKPVNFSGESSTGGTKGGLLSPDTKDVKDANNWKNRAAQKGINLEKAPKPQHGKGSEGQNNQSVVAESKKSVKKIIKK